MNGFHQTHLRMFEDDMIDIPRDARSVFIDRIRNMSVDQMMMLSHPLVVTSDLIAQERSRMVDDLVLESLPKYVQRIYNGNSFLRLFMLKRIARWHKINIEWNFNETKVFKGKKLLGKIRISA